MRQVVDMSARVVMEEEDNGFGWLRMASTPTPVSTTVGLFEARRNLATPLLIAHVPSSSHLEAA